MTIMLGPMQFLPHPSLALAFALGGPSPSLGGRAPSPAADPRSALFPLSSSPPAPSPSPAAGSPSVLLGRTTPSFPRLFLGLDLGQRADHSALALLERAESPTGEFDHAHWRPITRLTLSLRLLQVWPLNTPYLSIAAQTRDLLLQLRPQSRQALPPVLALDASGPGAPILEILRSARTGAQLQPVLITAGHHESLAKDSTLHVPRPLLLSQLRVLLERSLLAIPANLPHAPRLREELAALHHSKTGPHDDLAIALALAVHAALHFTPSLRRSL